MKNNIKKLYIFNSIRWFLVILPVLVLFFQDNGLSMYEVLLIQVAFSLTSLIFEVPSGYLSDNLGRKNTLIVGTIIASLGFFTYCLANSFVYFLIAQILLGLASSFISGTDSALIYDTLLSLKEQDKYKIIEGKYQSIANFSEAIAALVGGSIALISIKFNFYVMFFVSLLAIPLAISLVEPNFNKKKETKNPFNEIKKTIKYTLIENKKLKWFIIYSALINVMTFNVVWFIQPYLKELDLKLFFFGLIWAALNFSVGIFSLFAHKYESILGKKKYLLSLLLLSVLAYFSLGLLQSYISILFFFIFNFVRGVNTPIIRDYLNEIIKSEIRATVLSIQALIFRLIFCFIGPISGLIYDYYSLAYVMIFSGVIFSILGSITLILLKKELNRELIK